MSHLIPLAKLTWESAPVPAKDVGQPGRFEWIPLEKLMVDETYQRPIEPSGKKNIKRIIEEFHWTKFGPLIVSPRHGGVFAIIDGQHHAVAALFHGSIPECPCWVLTCTPEEEARAFSTINGIVTRVHSQYLFRARIASGDAGAVAADEAVRAAGGRIMPYPAQAHQLKVGETLAGRTIELILGKFGREPVVTAMELITKTGDGNPGLMKGDLIEGFAACLFRYPRWLANKTGALAAVNSRGVRSLYADAIKAAAAHNGGTIRSHANGVLAKLLYERLGEGGSDAQQKTLNEQARQDARPAKPASLPAVRRPAPQPPGSPAAEPQRTGVDLDHNGRFKITTYLIRKGHMASAERAGYRIDGQHMDIEEALELVNKHRAKADLPPIKIGEAV